MRINRLFKRTLQFAALAVSSLPPALAFATVETWPVGTPNACRNAGDGFMDFELGADAARISSTLPGLEFTTTGGLEWAYGDVRTGIYNVAPYNEAAYEANGNFFAWLGTTGDIGRITFVGGDATYFSALVSSSSLIFEAYDREGNFLADSGWAPDNRDTGTLSRVIVEAPNIAYVEIHDSGNFWVVDDICTDAPSPCIPLPGRATGPQDERIDVVFVADDSYTSMDTFRGDVDQRLAGLFSLFPVTGNEDRFNFYTANITASSAADNACGGYGDIIPDEFVDQCPFADAIAVLHTENYGDCRFGWTYSSEGNSDYSFVHESGHGIFDLRDEYERNFTRWEGPLTNIWGTRDDCESVVSTHGGNPDGCFQFAESDGGRWRLGDPSLPEEDRALDADFFFIMYDGGYMSHGWGDGATWHIEDLFAGLAAPPAMPAPYPEPEKSIVLELTISDDGVTVDGHGFFVAPPPNYHDLNYPYTVEMHASDGTWLGVYGFDDPRRIDGEPGYGGPTEVPVQSIHLALPYHYTIGTATVYGPDGSPVTVDLSQWATGEVGPAVDAGGPYFAVEGDVLTLTAETDATNIVSYEWDVDDDGLVDASSSSPVASYQTVDDVSGLVYVRILDTEGLSGIGSAPVTIVNVPPEVDAGASLETVVGELVTMNGAFSDPGIADTHGVEWFWGDDSSSTGTLAAGHVYATQGTYEVTLRVTDDDGGVGEDTLMVVVRHDACVYGDTVDIRDDAQVFANIASLGQRQGVEAGVWGNVVVAGDVTMSDRSLIEGDLTLSGLFSPGNDVDITGELLKGFGDVQVVSLPELAVAAGSGDLWLAGTQALTAGSYGNIWVRPNAVIMLAGGTYSLKSLTVEPEATLIAQESVELLVEQNVGFADRSIVQASSPESLLVYSNGDTVRIGNDMEFTGFVVAPSAQITICSRTEYYGCVGGRHVEIQPQALVDGGSLMLPQAW